MIRLERTCSWYRPYTVVASGTTYVLESIKFYDESGNIVATSSGWLQNQCGSDIPWIDLDTDKITRRNKEKFDGEVFGTVCHCSYNSEKRLNLYIPTSLVNLTYVGRKKMYGASVYDCYEGTQGIFLTHYVESLDQDLIKIRNQYDAGLSLIDRYHMEKDPDATIEILKQLITTVESYREEKERVNNIVVDDIK